jgi:hypothetical protein
VNHATQAIVTLDTRLFHGDRLGGHQPSWVRRGEIQCSMATVSVVVVREDGAQGADRYDHPSDRFVTVALQA